MPASPKKPLRVQPKAVPRPSNSVTTTGDDASLKGRPKTARDIMLDPHGIYGTRTASRLVVMKRRRNTQRGLVGGVLLIAAGVYGVRSFRFGHAMLTPLQTITLPGTPATAPITVEDAKGRALLVALQSGSLWCVAPNGGTTGPLTRRVWATGFPASAPPIAQGATVYLPGADGFLRAVNWRRGRGLWGVKMEGTPITPPLLVQLAVAPSAVPDAGDDSTPRRGTPNTTPQPASTNTQQIVIEGDDAGDVIACDAATGRVVWQRTLPGPVGNGLQSITFNKADAARQGVLVPLLSGPGRKGGLVCLEAQTGNTLWRYGLAVAAGASQFTASAVIEDAGQTRVVCADDDGSIVALAAESGTKLWPQKVFLRPQTEAARDDVVLPRGAPAAWMGSNSDTRTLAGSVAIGGNDGWLRAFATSGGRALWTFDAGAPLFQPAVPWLQPARGGEPARERLLVAPAAPVVWLLDAVRGTPEAEFALDAPASGPPLVINDQVFVLTQSGKILRFGLA